MKGLQKGDVVLVSGALLYVNNKGKLIFLLFIRTLSRGILIY